MAVNRYIPRAKAARYAAALPLRSQCLRNDAAADEVQHNVARRDNARFVKACVFLSFYLFILTLVPGLPHSADNIQWVCMRVNLGKNRFSDKEFRVWAKAEFTWSGQPRSLQDIHCNVAGQEDVEEEDEKAEE